MNANEENMNIKTTARHGKKWEGQVWHEVYGALLEFAAAGATRPEPIRCPVSVFRSACELARPLATGAAKRDIAALELAALGGYIRGVNVYPLPGSVGGDIAKPDIAAASGPDAFRDGDGHQ